MRYSVKVLVTQEIWVEVEATDYEDAIEKAEDHNEWITTEDVEPPKVDEVLELYHE